MTIQRPIPIRPTSPLTAAQHFARAAFAVAYTRVTAGHGEELIKCRELYPDDPITPQIISRAAVAPASTAGWGAQLVQTAYADFFSTLPASAASAIVARGLKASLGREGAVTAPARANTPGVLPWVGEGEPIPMRAGILSTTSLDPRKFGALVMFSRELAARANAEVIFTQLLREDAALSFDNAYFSATAGSSTAHPGLLNGVTPITATSGGGSNAVRTDLGLLIDAVAGVAPGEIVFVVSAKRAMQVAVHRYGVPDLAVDRFLGSAAVPDSRIIAVDPTALIHMFDPEPSFAASTETVVHRSDTPAQIGTAGSPNVVAAPSQSLFQTDCIALRVLGDVAFAARRSGAVAYLDDPTW